MKQSLLILLLLLCNTAFAQRVDIDRKSGLITVDGRPSFYLMGKNRILFQADYALENLQHEELAYLKAIQIQRYMPYYGTMTETFYAVTFSQSGNYCELHGLTGFSLFKALARNIAAARLVEGNRISRQAEQKFIVMNNGVFLNDPNDRGGRRPDDRYDNRPDRIRDDRNRRDDPRAGRNDDRYSDNGRQDNNKDRYGSNDRNNYDNQTDQPNPASGNNAAEAAPLPVKISISNGSIYDNDELIGTYKQTTGKTQDDVTITVYDVEKRKIATARRTGADWQIALVDDTSYRFKYDKNSPLITLFTSLAEKQYL